MNNRSIPLVVLFIFVLWLSFAQADGLIVEPFAGGFHYSVQAEDEFLVLTYKTNTETAECTIYSEAGEFSGDVEMLHTFAESPLKVTVETLKGAEMYAVSTQTVTVEQAILAVELPQESAQKLKNVEFSPLVGAVQYRFQAPGRASLLLKYRSATESGSVAICAGEDYWFEGILALPFTYNNSNVVLTVADIKNCNDLYEEMLRTDYPVPQAAAQGAGRLIGVTVCIDPGHQETAKQVTEPRGPGLSGTKQTDLGMARGTVTRRLESIVVLEIGFMLRDALLKEGATVVMTRETQDIYLSNIDRAEIATEANADFFLRLHCDMRDTQTAQGIGIFCPYGSDYAKAIASRDGWEAMGDILLSAMQSATGQAKGNTTTTNQYIGNNWATMPSFLIEMGYMSNPVEDLLLSAQPYQRRLVEGMVEGIYELAVYRGLIV